MTLERKYSNKLLKPTNLSFCLFTFISKCLSFVLVPHYFVLNNACELISILINSYQKKNRPVSFTRI